MNVENWKFMIKTLKRAKESGEGYTNNTWNDCAFGKYRRAKGLNTVMENPKSVDTLIRDEFDVAYHEAGPTSVFSNDAKTLDIAITNAEKYLNTYLEQHPELIKETQTMSLTVKQLSTSLKTFKELPVKQCFRYGNKLYAKTSEYYAFCFNDVSTVSLALATPVEPTKVEVIEIP